MDQDSIELDFESGPDSVFESDEENFIGVNYKIYKSISIKEDDHDSGLDTMDDPDPNDNNREDESSGSALSPQKTCWEDLDDDDVEAILSRRAAARAARNDNQRRPLYEAPEFVKRLNSLQEVESGTTVIFECQWRGFPKPAIKWYKDDIEITENNRYQVVSNDDGLETLKIEHAKVVDEGAYKCKLENQEGVASTTGYMSITGSDEPDSKPLSLLDHKTVERSVSFPPGLRSIPEQKSMEEREAEEYSRIPPSPLEEYLDDARKGNTWPMLGMSPEAFGIIPSYYEGNDETMSLGSDTSVDSQDLERVSFSVGHASGSDSSDSSPESTPPTPRKIIFSKPSPDGASGETISGKMEQPTRKLKSGKQQSVPPLIIVEDYEDSEHRRNRVQRQPLRRSGAIEIDDNGGCSNGTGTGAPNGEGKSKTSSRKRPLSSQPVTDLDDSLETMETSIIDIDDEKKMDSFKTKEDDGKMAKGNSISNSTKTNDTEETAKESPVRRFGVDEKDKEVVLNSLPPLVENFHSGDFVMVETTSIIACQPVMASNSSSSSKCSKSKTGSRSVTTGSGNGNNIANGTCSSMHNGNVPKVPSSGTVIAKPNKGQDIDLTENFWGCLDRLQNSPLDFYMLFITACGFAGSASGMPIALFVLAIVMFSLVSFRFILGNPIRS